MPRSVPAIIAVETLTKAAQPVIPAGGELVLRPWLRRDAPEVYLAFQDPAIQRWHARTAESVAEAQDWVEVWSRTWGVGTDANWAVADGRTGHIVGRASLRSMLPAQGSAEIAYWVMPSARGRGIAPRAVAALTAWAFDEIGFHRLELRHSVHNPQSCRVAIKSGFALEGVNRSATLHADGWHDMHMHARVSGDGAAQTLPFAAVETSGRFGSAGR